MTQPDFIMIPTQLLSDSSLQPSDRILFGYIYWMTKLALMKCVASNETLSELTGFSERNIRISLDRLEQQGYVGRIYKGEGKRNRLEIIVTVAFSAVTVNNEGTGVPSRRKHGSVVEGTGVPHNKKREEEHLKRKAQSALDLLELDNLEPQISAYVEARKVMRKPLTRASLKLIIDKLESMYPSNREKQRQCLENSVIGSWTTVYPLKEEAKPEPNVGLSPGQILHPEKYGRTP